MSVTTARDAELEETLTAKGKTAERDRVAAIVPDGVQVDFVYQEKPLGLGHAVLCAREIVGDEPFAVLLPDDLVQAEPGCLAQMTSRYEEARYEETAGNFLAVETVPRNRTDRYGILETGAGEQPPADWRKSGDWSRNRRRTMPRRPWRSSAATFCNRRSLPPWRTSGGGPAANSS